MSSGKPLEPTINVTPLVDVVLVLLIIFMVIAPAMAESNVSLPKSGTRDPNEEDAIHVVLPKSGDPTVDGAVTARANAGERLRELVAESKRAVVIEADSGLPYGDVRTLFASVKGAGAKSVSLQIVEEKP
ncbi:MAG: biopolymer transporter ExbD [Polyangiaceae bacterium]